jgi:hypothetical protein
MTRSIAVVCEAPADARIACHLADRVLREVEWINDSADHLDEFRCFRGFLVGEPYLLWRDVRKIATQHEIDETLGFFEGVLVHGSKWSDP